MFSLSYLQLCNHVRYVTFNTNLSICSMKKMTFILPQCTWMCLSLIMLGLLLNGCEEYQILLFIFGHSPYVGSLVEIVLNSSKLLSWTISGTLSIYIFSIAIPPVAHILCLMIFQTWCFLCTKNVSHWLLVIFLILSNDIHLNPGPHLQNNVFNFMSWNINSLAKDNFKRVRLIEAHNSIFNYDLISICETSLNDSVELPETLLDVYTFVPANKPGNISHGGVGLFYKNSLPVIVRNDLSFDESIIVELKFGRKKIFFTVLYRSSSIRYTSPEFCAF